MRYHEIVNEARVTVWSGATINVLHNPSRPAFEDFAKRYEVLRGCLSFDGRNVWLWSAAAAVHPNIMQELGLEHVDCIFYNRGKWQGPGIETREGTYAPAIERLTPKPKPQWTAQDEAMWKELEADPDFRKLMGESVIQEARVWDEMDETPVYKNPSRSDFVGLMRNTAKQHGLPLNVDGDFSTPILRGFIDMDGNILIWDAWEHTHVDAMGYGIGSPVHIRLSFWMDHGLVGIGSPDDAEAALKNRLLIQMMGGPFEVEEAY